MMWILLAIAYFVWPIPIIHGQTLRYSSGCSVPLCNNISSSGSSCSSSPTCYQFRTINNTNLCAPQVVCSLFDACVSGTKCATNTSVCVINSCCTVPICMPLALSSQCNMQGISNSANQICQNATWNPNATQIIPSVYNGSYQFSPTDFTIDSADNIYVIDSYSKQFFKFAANGSSGTPVAGPGNSTAFTIYLLFVDSSGAIYTYESENRYIYGSASYAYYYRIQKYDSYNWIGGTTIFGETQCNAGLTGFCGCADIFVDGQGAVYCSDNTNNRVIKITLNNPFATIVAGVTNTSGSQLNQLNNPRGIFVDANNTVYIADMGNSRVLAFSPGNQYGRYLFYYSGGMYGSGNGGLILDNSGNIYVATSSNVTRWAPSTSIVTPILSGYYYYYSTRMRLDSKGNIYMTPYMSSGVSKYNILSNTC